MRELRNRRTIQELEVVTWAQDPTAMFLAEMWSVEARLRKLCADLKFDHCWIGPSASKSGYLALFWKKSVCIDLVSDSPNHIDAIVGEVDHE